MAKGKLLSDNPELLHYSAGKLHITILGGIKLTGLDRLKVTLKIICTDRKQLTFRHNVDLYNHIQTGQLIERVAETLDVTTTEVSEAVSQLITALETYRAEHLEALKPKQVEAKELTEAERKIALAFLKAPQLLNRTCEAISHTGIIGEETNALIAYLIFTSRKRHTPLHLMCLGASGTGKTWLQEKVGELIPEEDGKVLEAIATDRKDNLAVEARDHIRTFHELFFTLAPDEKVIQTNLAKALYLADASAKDEYDNLRENGYFANMIAGNVSQQLKIDSIAVDLRSYPYRFRCYGIQNIIRTSSTVSRSLITEGELRSISKSDNNPHGFLIQRWHTIENIDLKVDNH